MKKSAVITTALSILCGLSQSAQAAITIFPEDLTIKAARGDVVTRTLTVNSDAPIQGLDIVRLDLTRDDGAITLPSTAISTDILQDSSEGSQDSAEVQETLQQVLVTFDLSDMEQSGEFDGVLLVQYEGGEQEIPLTLMVKDAVWWPLAVLLAGVVLGVGLSVYRAEGRDRDQLVVQIGRIRTRMRADDGLTDSFKTSINAYLAIADTQLDDKRWIDAARSIGNAQSLWQKWLQHRQDWMAQIQYVKELTEEAEKQIPEAVPYGQIVFAALADLNKHASEYETPQHIRDDVLKVRHYVERYERGRASLNKFESLRTQLSDTRKEVWKNRKVQLERRLNVLNPVDEETFAPAFQQWQADAAVAIQDIAKIIDKNRATESGDESAPLGVRDLQVMPLQQPGLVPEVSKVISNERSIAHARWRLVAVNWLSRSIAIIMLSWAGLNQLYETKSTFGAASFTDYFALLAWGVGAETTRSSIIKVIQDLGVPLPKQ